MTVLEVVVEGVGDGCASEDEVEGIGDGGGWRRGKPLLGSF